MVFQPKMNEFIDMRKGDANKVKSLEEVGTTTLFINSNKNDEVATIEL